MISIWTKEWSKRIRINDLISRQLSEWKKMRAETNSLWVSLEFSFRFLLLLAPAWKGSRSSSAAKLLMSIIWLPKPCSSRFSEYLVSQRSRRERGKTVFISEITFYYDTSFGIEMYTAEVKWIIPQTIIAESILLRLEIPAHWKSDERILRMGSSLESSKRSTSEERSEENLICEEWMSLYARLTHSLREDSRRNVYLMLLPALCSGKSLRWLWKQLTKEKECKALVKNWKVKNVLNSDYHKSGERATHLKIPEKRWPLATASNDTRALACSAPLLWLFPH